jgi:hypothetical protein
MTTRAEAISRILELDAKRTPSPWVTDYTANIWGDANNPAHDGDSPLLMNSFGNGKEQTVNSQFTCEIANNAPRIIRDLVAENEALKVKADLFGKLRDLCGYVEDASDTGVLISQDDATKGWVIRVGTRTFYADSFNDAIIEAHSKEFKS